MEIDWVPKVSEKMAYSGLFWCFRRISGFFLKIGNFGVSEASPINTDVFVEREQMFHKATTKPDRLLALGRDRDFLLMGSRIFG